ncbi:hypothetical protein D3C81_1582920 [compost metagenome]
MRIALMQEQRLAHAVNGKVRSNLQLALEGLALRRARREIPVVIQSALAHRYYFRVRMQRAHFRVAFVGVFAGMVRMHAGRGVQEPRVALRQCQRHRRMLAAGAGDQHLHHAGCARAFQHRVQVAIKGFVGEVGADVDQLH